MQYKALLVATFFIAGCSSSIQQRPVSSVCNEISSDSTTCSKSSFLILDSNGASEKSTLAFVEYNEDGVPYDQNNIAAVTTQIKDLAKKSEKSLLLVVFIHGWNHNASQSDTNVKQFKLFLQTLQKEESTLNVGRPRAVVGVYVGWQGRASEFELLRLLSYRKKKELGLKTGNSVTAVLRELSAIRSDDKNSRLVVVGHSFGGGVLYSAVKQDLLSSLKDNTSTSGAFYGDLIALINPAVEAGQFSEVHAALDKNFPECTPISMISFTSEADTALSNEFPRGMKIFYRDQIHDDERDAYLTTAYGRYEDFSKYQLRPTAGSTVESSLSSSSFKAAAKTWIPFRKGQSPFTISGLTLEPRGNIAAKPWEPILNVYVDKTLIQEHNEIWDPKFTYFLRSFIGMNFLKDRPCR